MTSEYGDRSKAITAAALREIHGILEGRGVSFRVIGGAAVQVVLQSCSASEMASHYIGTLDVDLATADGTSRDELRRVLLEAGARQDGGNPDRVWLLVDVDGDQLEAPVDTITLSLVGGVPDVAEGTVLSLPLLLLTKMRPYANDGEKGKDGYDVYMLLACAAGGPEVAAERCAEELPGDLAEELMRLAEVFFLITRRAARHAATVLRDYHNMTRREAFAEVTSVAERFVRTLRERLDG